MNADQHFVLFRNRYVDVFHVEHIGRTVSIADEGLHSAHLAPVDHGVMTILSVTQPSCRYRIAAGTSLSGNVLAMIGASCPDSRSVLKQAIASALLRTLKFCASWDWQEYGQLPSSCVRPTARR